MLIQFPGGGGRLEVAKPLFRDVNLPGPVCPKCYALRLPEEEETLVEDAVPLASDDLDWLLDRLLDRMRDRAEAKLAGTP